MAEEVPGTVILCTTTHIRPFPAYPLLTEPTPEIVRQALANSRVLCLGTPCENNKLTAPALPLDVLAGLADYVLVEADGSRQLPLKAHGPQEPVIPLPAAGPSAWQAPPASAGPSGRRSTGRSGSAPSPARRKRPQPRRELAARALLAEHLCDTVFLNQLDRPEQLPAGPELRRSPVSPRHPGVGRQSPLRQHFPFGMTVHGGKPLFCRRPSLFTKTGFFLCTP